MTEDIISSKWSRLAKDGGGISLQHFDYDVVVGGDVAQEITTTPTNIGYSPSVNKAKDITLDVPPATALEDLSYLGEPIKLYVDQQIAFDGEVKEIQTQQKNGSDYTITGEPYGKKLTGSDIEDTVNNEVVSDTLSRLVDRFNEYHNEHRALTGTSSETLNDVIAVGGNVRESVGSPGTATYSSVGSDLSVVTSIYVKAYVPSDETLTLNATTNSVTDIKTVSGLDKNSYGEWVRFSGFANSTEEYDLEFELEQDSSLMDWISVVDEVVKRDTTSPDVGILSQDEQFYSVTDADADGDGNSELQANTNVQGNGIVFDSNGRPQTRQISAWGKNPFPVRGDSEFVNGEGTKVEVGESRCKWDISTSEALDRWDIYARVKPYEIFVNRKQEHTNGNTPYDDAWSSSASASTTQVAVDTTSVEITGDAHKGFQWDYNRVNQFGKFTLESQAYLPATGNYEWVIESGGNGYGLRILSGDLDIVRIDSGTTTVLNTDTSYVQQTGEWFDFSITVGENGDDISVTVSDSGGNYSLTATDINYDVFSEFQVYTTDTHYLDDMFGNVGGTIKNMDIKFEVGANSHTYGITTSAVYRGKEWIRIASYDFISSFPESLSGSTEIGITATAQSETGFGISPLVAVHEKTNWDDSDFDLTLHEPEGHLNYPPVYANGDVFDNTITFNEKVSEENIFEATVESTITNITNVTSDWGVSQIIDTSATDFPTPSNSETSQRSFAYPGVQHVVQITLSASGLRDNASPRTGYRRQRLDNFTVTISTSDIEVLYNQDLSGNRLSSMNSIAGESSALFRWEGDTAKIFHIGQETTDVDVRSGNIQSSVSIEDVYRYCEVIGLHNVRSGVIESADAPAYVDDKKVIRDDSIENRSDAISRAKRFLAKHGKIKFKGNIQTMPTFAPLGAEMDGGMFNHGQDMIINGVRYGKRGTSITLGYDKNIASELIALHKNASDTRGRTTGKGMKIPVGEDQI